MADYKRMVSYMYQYESGVKKKNVGFARIEVKDGQCKITIHMQLLGQLDSIFPTYLIQRGNGRTELINLGDTILKNQVMDSRLIADEKNIMDSGYGLSDMGGLLLFLNDNVFFATEWDDKPILAAEVLEALRPKNKTDFRAGITEEKSKVKAEETSKEQTGEVKSEKKFEIEAEDETETVLSLEEELAIPKYKLPRGYKIIERMQRPEIAIDKADQNDLKTQKLQERLDTSLSEGKQDRLYASMSEGKKERLDASMSDGKKERLEASASGGKQERLYTSASDEVQVADFNTTMEGQSGTTDFRNDDQAVTNVQSQVVAEAANRLTEEALHTVTDEALNKVTEEALNMVTEEEPEKHEMEQTDPKVASDIFEKYPRIYPFEDNEILLCVKIEPKDIGLLPKELWVLSNNSFLVHGYYCYHHLIFAKLRDHYKSRFILGVPGIYHDRERFMARMFGFECFKPIRRRELRQGDFGYWYMPVTF